MVSENWKNMERLQVSPIQCIYAIVNVVNQRVYVGSTKDFYVRVDGHKRTRADQQRVKKAQKKGLPLVA